MMTDTKPTLIHVAVGVIENARGEIFIAKRSDEAHQGGLWEFPGGKVEAGETIVQALDRELFEELGIRVQGCEPLIEIFHDYSCKESGNKHVRLEIRRVINFSGEPHGKEGQPVCWVAKSELDNFQFPAANKPVIAALKLPKTMVITPEHAEPLEALKTCLEAGAGLVQWRQDRLKHAQVLCDTLLEEVRLAAELCASYLASLQLNCSLELYTEIQKQLPDLPLGLHLSSDRLVELATEVDTVVGTVLDTAIEGTSGYLGASCHNLEQLEQALAIGCDYGCLSPVLSTRSHPEVHPLGWQEFSRLAGAAKFPVYALGGLSGQDLNQAIEMGAQGVAGISAYWPSQASS